MSTPEIRPGSWNELMDALYTGTWNERLSRHRGHLAFRGMGDASYDLHTSLHRMGGSVQHLETAMLRALRRYAPRQVMPDNSVWNWLALAQHHHLPTRLLDWSYSPLVALHFATENPRRYECDGIVWVIDFAKANELLPERLKRVLEHEDTFVFTADMLEDIAASLADFDALAESEFLAWFEPPSFDERIVNQYALFSLPSQPDLDLERWLAQHADIYRRVIVPAELKWEVRDKLDMANITERVVYPGLDGLGRWLTRYYTPRKLHEGKAPHER